MPASLGRALLNKFLMQSYYILWNVSKLCVLRRKTHFIKLNQVLMILQRHEHQIMAGMKMYLCLQIGKWLLWILEKENIVVNLIELIQHLFQFKLVEGFHAEGKLTQSTYGCCIVLLIYKVRLSRYRFLFQHVMYFYYRKPEV